MVDIRLRAKQQYQTEMLLSGTGKLGKLILYYPNGKTLIHSVWDNNQQRLYGAKVMVHALLWLNVLAMFQNL